MSKNLEKCYNTSDNTDTEQFLLSVLVFIDSLVAQVAFGLPYLLIDLFYIGMPVVRTDGRLLVRAVYGHVISKFLGWVDLLSYGAPQAHASRARKAPLRTELIYTFRDGLNIGVYPKYTGSYSCSNTGFTVFL